jgi:hypothetical protein
MSLQITEYWFFSVSLADWVSFYLFSFSERSDPKGLSTFNFRHDQIGVTTVSLWKDLAPRVFPLPLILRVDPHKGFELLIRSRVLKPKSKLAYMLVWVSADFSTVQGGTVQGGDICTPSLTISIKHRNRTSVQKFWINDVSTFWIILCVWQQR